MKLTRMVTSSLIFLSLVFSCAQNKTNNSERDNYVMRDTSSENDPWTDWYNSRTEVKGLILLSRIRSKLLESNLHDPHVSYDGYEPVNCPAEGLKHRSADGTCYDVNQPHVGASGVAFGRNVPPEFIDLQGKEKMMKPNPKLVSDVFFDRGDDFKAVPFLNMLAVSWIQFMNHDWFSHGRNDESHPSYKIPDTPGQIGVVEPTKENKVHNSHYKSEFGQTTINDVTHWWDASQIYGSNSVTQNRIRMKLRGKMKTEFVNKRELLPRDLNFKKDNKQNFGQILTGFRDNWWVGLSMLHILFVKEHNYIADNLFDEYVKGQRDGKWIWKEENGIEKSFTTEELDEHIFQITRLINSAVLAKIHTVEWTPAILKNKTLKKAMNTNWYGLFNPKTWSKYLKRIPGLSRTSLFDKKSSNHILSGIVGEERNDSGVPFSITEEFTSVYRLHSLLPEMLSLGTLANRADDSKRVNIRLDDVRNEKSYDIMKMYDLKDLFYSFGTQHPGQIVLNNMPNFIRNLQIPGLGVMDVGMVDILRDRERGVPRYNQFRRALHLRPISSYEDFFPKEKVNGEREQKVIQKFRDVYGVDEQSGKDNVEDIDLLVGTLAEEVRPTNFGFGETQFHLFILMASRRLMADPFFTDKYGPEYYTKKGIEWIDFEGQFHKVIARHMPELSPHFPKNDSAFAPWSK